MVPRRVPRRHAEVPGESSSAAVQLRRSRRHLRARCALPQSAPHHDSALRRSNIHRRFARMSSTSRSSSASASSGGAIAADGGFGGAADRGGDALPLRDARRRLDVLQLPPEGGDARIVREAARGPRRRTRRQVAAQAVERQLLLGGGEERDQRAGGVGMWRVGGDGETGAAGDRDSRRVRLATRHRRRRPARLQVGRQARRQLAEVPRPGDENAEEAGGEVLVQIGDLPFPGRREVALEKAQVEHEGVAEPRRLKVAPLVRRRGAAWPRVERPGSPASATRRGAGGGRSGRVRRAVSDRRAPVASRPSRSAGRPSRRRGADRSDRKGAGCRRTTRPPRCGRRCDSRRRCRRTRRHRCRRAGTWRRAAPRATSSGIQVVPAWKRSGIDPPTKAVRSFSWAALQGICWTRTRTSGWARSKAGRSCCTTSPSRPMAQKRSSVRGGPPARVRTPPPRPSRRRPGSRRLAS